MPPRRIDVTPAEFRILEVLWAEGPTTIRKIAEQVYDRPSIAEYATAQKLLDRLALKGCVQRDRRSFAHVITATVSRAKLIGYALENLADKLCGGSLTPLLLHLTERSCLSDSEREMLRKLIKSK